MKQDVINMKEMKTPEDIIQSININKFNIMAIQKTKKLSEITYFGKDKFD